MAPDIPRRSRRVSLGSPSRPFSSLLRCRRADGGAEAGALGGATGASRRADLRRDVGALRGSRRLVGGATASRAWRPQTRSKLNLTASPLPRLLASERRAETVEPDCHRSVDARRCRPMAERRHRPKLDPGSMVGGRKSPARHPQPATRNSPFPRGSNRPRRPTAQSEASRLAGLLPCFCSTSRAAMASRSPSPSRRMTMRDA